MSNLLEIAPHKPTWWETVTRIIVGFIIWLIMALLIFVILILIWWIFDQALRNNVSWSTANVHPLLPFIMMIIAFVSSFIWNIVISWAYNLFFSDKYYDFVKMAKIVLINNFILFFIFAPLYILFYNKIETIFVILAFHILFSVFVCASSIEVITNPNYSVSHIMWSSIWFAFSILILWVVYKSIDLSNWNSVTILLSLPPILGYTLIPLAHSIWENIYFKFYEMGNNFFYVPSIDDIMVEEDENDTINVD